MEVIGDGKQTFLIVDRLYGMRIPPSRALDMSESPCLTIGYLLMNKQ